MQIDIHWLQKKPMRNFEQAKDINTVSVGMAQSVMEFLDIKLVKGKKPFTKLTKE